MDTSQIFRNAPKYISQRFSAINSYTWGALFPGNSLNDRLRQFQRGQESIVELSRIKDVVNEASLAIFIFLMKRFFVDGTNAAIQAVDTFKELGIDSFQIGSKKFANRNKNVMKGQELADKLMDSITNQELKVLINSSQYANQIIEKYKSLIDG